MQDLAEQGVRVKSLESRPELDEGVVFFWNAFQMLSPSRSVGMAVGGIPFSEILAFCDMAELRGIEERIEFVRVIQSMDAEFLKHKPGGGGKNAGA